MIRSALFAMLLGIVSTAASALETTEIRVGGTVRPTACNVTLTNNGVFDYGTVPAAHLKTSGMTLLGATDTEMQIQCDSPTQIGLRIIDNRADSKVPYVNTYPENYYGIGKVGDRNIGSYAVALKNGTADGKTTLPITTKDDGASWLRLTGNYYTADTRLYSWALDGTSAPAIIQNLRQPLEVKVWVDNKQNLPVEDDIPLDGSSTISVVYL